jgi:dipeptidyl aminopeptidase/acylaminoacyl peptidase
MMAVWPWPASSDEGTRRVLRPNGNPPYPVIMLVPGCSGFVANNGINVYDERAAELQAAGNLVVYVDYVGVRMQTNCAHVGLMEVKADILGAAKWAAAQSAVDASRISVIGWSYGGGGVLGRRQ